MFAELCELFVTRSCVCCCGRHADSPSGCNSPLVSAFAADCPLCCHHFEAVPVETKPKTQNKPRGDFLKQLGTVCLSPVFYSRSALLHLHFRNNGNAQSCHRGAQQVRTSGGTSLLRSVSLRRTPSFTLLARLARAAFFQVLPYRCLRLLRLQNAPAGRPLQLPPPLPFCG